MVAGPRKLDEILRTVVGSGVHGIAIEGTDDHDEMGVFIEPPDNALGLAGTLDHDVWRTQPEGARSGPGDIDLVRYSLRKYIRLAVKGNPTVLLPLYAPPGDVLVETRLGRELRDLTPLIVSRQAGRRFLGYMQAQLERMQGGGKQNRLPKRPELVEAHGYDTKYASHALRLAMQGGGKQNRLPKRPELVEAHGYDTKYASHALRLAMQGVELLETGRLQLPMREDRRELVREVKAGNVGRGEVLDEIRSYEARLKLLLDAGVGPLRETPDVGAVSAWVVRAHARHWRTHLAWRSPTHSVDVRLNQPDTP